MQYSLLLKISNPGGLFYATLAFMIKSKTYTREPVSMVITGLIKGRMSTQLNLKQIISSLIIFKEINPRNEIIISTYRNQTPKALLKYIDRVVINNDPGPDVYINDRWRLFRGEIKPTINHNTRFFLLNYNGIKECRNNLVLKTRIEMLPENSSQLDNLIEQYFVSRSPDIPEVGFFTEHYSGVRFSIHGILGEIPGTIQIGKKKTLESIYRESLTFWQNEKQRLTKEHRHVLIVEQILGLNFLFLFCEFPLYSEIHKLNKYYISIKLIKAIIRAEEKNFIFLSLKQSGFALYKYQGTRYIKTPKDIYKISRTKIALKLIIVISKRYKHLVRKYLRARYVLSTIPRN